MLAEGRVRAPLRQIRFPWRTFLRAASHRGDAASVTPFPCCSGVALALNLPRPAPVLLSKYHVEVSVGTVYRRAPGFPGRHFAAGDPGSISRPAAGNRLQLGAGDRKSVV